MMMVNKPLVLTYLYLLIYILLSSGVILYNKWVLSPKYFNFPFPITLTMIHMGFSGAVAFFLIRVFKVVSPVKMTLELYITCVVPISAFFAASLWFGNTAYLYISVAFIQMLKALMPVATFIMAVMCGTDKARSQASLQKLLGWYYISVLQELFLFQMRMMSYGVFRGLQCNAVGYFLCFVFLCAPWYVLEKPGMEISQIQFNFWIFFSNALCALALNFSIFLVIGRTGAVTIRVAGVLKDWILIALSTVIFPESTITGLNIIGYAIALCGVVMYNYLKVKDVRASQLPESIPDRMTKDWKLEKKSSDIFTPKNSSDNNGGGGGGSMNSSSDTNVDEETPLISSRLSHVGRSQLSK
ncbi:SUGAR PHOSPHATE TRANSPORTER DOMAIN-CONTAINING PROTEIN-RELATED [Salix purpurea]|uniref:SUGAR PHOSPHATE TRANSPORTER DOMAIN-CONTAINING PROTEIN-RELATED n=1 Tax=Salix purpurea TaxID=77065 RepID=A0A9Q0Z3G6_SALPP|nr:SUGAR PHOSPHATE TRANSPORTER DOMAIN-CONTAINING PROTEIN-RELATED [Salix purpurea]